MLVELYVGNYATYDGLLNGVGGIFKTLTTYCDKTIIWILFQNFKIKNWQEKNSYYYNNNGQTNGHQ